MAVGGNSEASLFLDINTPLFQDGFIDDSSDVSTAESVAMEDEEFIIEIIADKPNPRPRPCCTLSSSRCTPSHVALGNQRLVS